MNEWIFISLKRKVHFYEWEKNWMGSVEPKMGHEFF